MTGTTPDFAKLAEELGAHPAVEAMAQAVRKAATQAATARETRFPLAPHPELEAPEQEEPGDAWATPWGNAWEVLKTGAKSAEHVALVRALFALGLREEFPSAPESELSAAATVCWLAAHTTCDAFEPLDSALEEGAKAFWQAVAQLIEDPTASAIQLGRTEALVAAVGLGEAKSDAARETARTLAKRLDDPVLSSVLERRTPPAESKELSGELSPTPRGPVLTAVLAFTLVLAIVHTGRLIGRYVFAYKRPAKVLLSQRGLEVTYHTELLGKVLRERATLVPLSNLASVTREVRFARLGMYAGLVALVLGSYLGMGLFVDGVRVPGGSLTLIGLALGLVLLGLLIDFGLSSLSDSVKGTCRIVVVPRKGPAVCIGALSSSDADAVLNTIAEQTRA